MITSLSGAGADSSPTMSLPTASGAGIRAMIEGMQEAPAFALSPPRVRGSLWPQSRAQLCSTATANSWSKCKWGNRYGHRWRMGVRTQTPIASHSRAAILASLPPFGDAHHGPPQPSRSMAPRRRGFLRPRRCPAPPPPRPLNRRAIARLASHLRASIAAGNDTEALTHTRMRNTSVLSLGCEHKTARHAGSQNSFPTCV